MLPTGWGWVRIERSMGALLSPEVFFNGCVVVQHAKNQQ
jgi:hypothetical protein